MISGIISLQPLYDLIQSDSAHHGLISGTSQRRLYGRVATELSKTIADQQGFYLWGRYDHNRF